MSITLPQIEKFFKKRNILYIRHNKVIEIVNGINNTILIMEKGKSLIIDFNQGLCSFEFTSIEYDENDLYFCMDNAKLKV